MYGVLHEIVRFFFEFYLFIHDREREAETQAEGEAGSMPGARRGTRSQDSRIVPWAKGRCQTAEPPRDPPDYFFLRQYNLFFSLHFNFYTSTVCISIF